MKIKEEDYVNKKFNNLTIIRKTSNKLGTSYLWECKCDCGNITLSTIASLKKGHKKSCGCLQRKQISQLGKSKKKDLTNKIFGDLIVLEDTKEISDGRHVWKCQCSCGNIINISSSKLTQNIKTHCGCKTVRSQGERKIKELLLKFNIPFIQEYIFSDIQNKKLRFDFYVNNQYVIEYDGRQHYLYEPFGYGADLKNIQKRDSIKNSYCLEKNIPLIRIPYTHFDSLTIDDLLLEHTKFLLKEDENNET